MMVQLVALYSSIERRSHYTKKLLYKYYVHYKDNLVNIKSVQQKEKNV